MGGGKRESPDRSCLRSQDHTPFVVAAGIVSELSKLGVDVAPGVSALGRLDEGRRHCPARAHRLAKSVEELFVVPAVSHAPLLLTSGGARQRFKAPGPMRADAPNWHP